MKKDNERQILKRNFQLLPEYSDYGDITGAITLRRLVKWINENVDILNEFIIDFKDKYDEIIDIQKEYLRFETEWEQMKIDNAEFVLDVTKRLDDWIDDPRLKELLNDELLSMKLDKSEFEQFKTTYESFKTEIASEMQQLKESTNSSLNEFNSKLEVANENIHENTVPDNVNMDLLFRHAHRRVDGTIQYINTQGMTTDGNYVYMCMIPLNMDEGNLIIKKFDMVGNLVLEKMINDGFHGNSMTMGDGRLYLATTKNSRIKVFTETLEHVRDITTSVNVNQLSYKDGELWTLGQSKDMINILDLNGKVIRTLKLDDSPLKPTNIDQSFCVSDFIYRIKAYPSTMIVYTLDGKLVRNVSMSTLFTVKEFEDIDVVDGVIYSSYHTGMNESNWTTGVAVGSFTNSNFNLVRAAQSDSAIDVYVDNKVKIFNPDGSQSRPFATIQEAIDYLHHFSNLNKRIYVDGGGDPYTFFRINGQNQVNVYGTNNPKIEGCLVFNANNVLLSQITLSEHNNICLEVNDSNIRVANVTFDYVTTAIEISSLASVMLHGSLASLSGTSSIKLKTGGAVYGSRLNPFDYVLPLDSFFRTETPIRIYEGDIKDGNGAFRTGINSSLFSKFVFVMSNGQIIETKGGNGIKELRVINMGNDATSITSIFAELLVNVSGSSFTVSGKAFSVDESGIKKVNNAFTIKEIYGH